MYDLPAQYPVIVVSHDYHDEKEHCIAGDRAHLLRILLHLLADRVSDGRALSREDIDSLHQKTLHRIERSHSKLAREAAELGQEQIQALPESLRPIMQEAAQDLREAQEKEQQRYETELAEHLLMLRLIGAPGAEPLSDPAEIERTLLELIRPWIEEEDTFPIEVIGPVRIG